jgi:cellulose 1,4-beta-cellobiosidase
VVGIFSPTAPPPAPSSLAATVSNNQVSLTWATAASATGYNIYRAVSSGTEGTVPYKSGVVASPFVDPTTTHGTAYFYMVTAVSPAGESVKSSEVPATP